MAALHALNVGHPMMAIDTTFCTPYNLALYSLVMLKLQGPRLVQSPIKYQIDLRSVKMENITF